MKIFFENAVLATISYNSFIKIGPFFTYIEVEMVACVLICSQVTEYNHLMVIYHPLYTMNNFVTNKSKLPHDGARVFPYMG